MPQIASLCASAAAQAKAGTSSAAAPKRSAANGTILLKWSASPWFFTTTGRAGLWLDELEDSVGIDESPIQPAPMPTPEERPITFRIAFQDASLDSEDLDQQEQNLLAELKDLAGIETTGRVLDPNPAAENKAMAGYLDCSRRK